MLSDNDLCSHRRSWFYWAESIANKDKKSFPAVKCKSWDHFKDGKCEQAADIAYMGIDCPFDASGNYYLQTNGERPFSKGMTGITYVPRKRSTENQNFLKDEKLKEEKFTAKVDEL